MSKTVTTRFDIAEHLGTPEEKAAYLEACIEEANGDAVFIAKPLGDIARAKGMSQVARDVGLTNDNLSETQSGAKKLLAREYVRMSEVKSRLINDIVKFEKQYHLDSEDFYRLYEAGEVGDKMDFVEWAATVEMLAGLNQ